MFDNPDADTHPSLYRFRSERRVCYPSPSSQQESNLQSQEDIVPSSPRRRSSSSPLSISVGNNQGDEPSLTQYGVADLYEENTLSRSSSLSPLTLLSHEKNPNQDRHSTSPIGESNKESNKTECDPSNSTVVDMVCSREDAKVRKHAL